MARSNHDMKPAVARAAVLAELCAAGPELGRLERFMSGLVQHDLVLLFNALNNYCEMATRPPVLPRTGDGVRRQRVTLDLAADSRVVSMLLDHMKDLRAIALALAGAPIEGVRISGPDTPPVSMMTDAQVSNVLHGRRHDDNGTDTASSMGAAQDFIAAIGGVPSERSAEGEYTLQNLCEHLSEDGLEWLISTAGMALVDRFPKGPTIEPIPIDRIPPCSCGSTRVVGADRRCEDCGGVALDAMRGTDAGAPSDDPLPCSCPTIPVNAENGETCEDCGGMIILPPPDAPPSC